MYVFATSDRVKFWLLYAYVKAAPVPSPPSPVLKVYGRRAFREEQKPLEGGSLFATLYAEAFVGLDVLAG